MSGEEAAVEESLERLIRRHVQRYFHSHEDGLPPPGIYSRILPLMERPLLEEALLATKGNQLKAAELLGINRNTLRKWLRELGMAL